MNIPKNDYHLVERALESIFLRNRWFDCESNIWTHWFLVCIKRTCPGCEHVKAVLIFVIVISDWADYCLGLKPQYISASSVYIVTSICLAVVLYTFTPPIC